MMPAAHVEEKLGQLYFQYNMSNKIGYLLQTLIFIQLAGITYIVLL